MRNWESYYANRAEIDKQFPGQFIEVDNGQVVASGRFPRDLMDSPARRPFGTRTPDLPPSG